MSLCSKSGIICFVSTHFIDHPHFFPARSGPAPRGLCTDVQGFDLKSNSTFCPVQRNALYDIFVYAKGSEWTNDQGWDDQLTHYCKWHGITCDKDENTIGINLMNNGLSGVLHEQIGALSALETIDLSDNDVKGSVPETISNLSNLRELRLSYNAFTGSIPRSLNQLQNLQLVQLQSNRITGEIELHMSEGFVQNPITLIADCGEYILFSALFVQYL